MSSEPINNPPTPPSPAAQPVPSPTEGSPSAVPGQDQPPEFTLPSGPAKRPEGAAGSDKPNPMDVAKDAAHSQGWSQQQIQDDMKSLQKNLQNAQNKLQDPSVTQKFSDDHYTALGKLTDKMTPDMKTVGKLTQGNFDLPGQQKGESVLQYVLRWIGGAQETMAGALAYASTIKNPNPADMMRLQFAMHRATERGELFSSIIGSTVSGIKTIMSAQLG